jgi:hypothetical protein
METAMIPSEQNHECEKQNRLLIEALKPFASVAPKFRKLGIKSWDMPQERISAANVYAAHELLNAINRQYPQPQPQEQTVSEEPASEAKPLQLEAGKYYRNRKGEKIGPIAVRDYGGMQTTYCWVEKNNGRIYENDGTSYSPGQQDLIAPWTEPAHPDAPQPGSVESVWNRPQRSPIEQLEKNNLDQRNEILRLHSVVRELRAERDQLAAKCKEETERANSVFTQGVESINSMSKTIMQLKAELATAKAVTEDAAKLFELIQDMDNKYALGSAERAFREIRGGIKDWLAKAYPVAALKAQAKGEEWRTPTKQDIGKLVQVRDFDGEEWSALELFCILEQSEYKFVCGYLGDKFDCPCGYKQCRVRDEKGAEQ